MKDSNDDQPFSRPWLWLFPPAYLAHLIDERFWGPGTANWAYANTGVYFTNAGWLAVNIPSMVLLTVAAALAAARVWPQWVGVALAVHFALHALVRIIGTAATAQVAPGVVTGVLICLPLALPTLSRGYRRLSMPDYRKGLLAGVFSFQPLWHTVLLPLLPKGPAA